MTSLTSVVVNSTTTIGVGFGTAGLGGNGYQITLMALDAGFRKFDTAEADGWYDQKSVGLALKDYFVGDAEEECTSTASAATTPRNNKRKSSKSCSEEDLRISTKIPPWSMTSATDIRSHARQSRRDLVGFCGGIPQLYSHNSNEGESDGETYPYPLDVYYIHAPTCWKGWHPRCDNPPANLLNLYDAWLGMEAVVGIDHSAKRIGLSNVHPLELRKLIFWVQHRQELGDASARMPDVLQAFADPLQPAEELRGICAQYGIEFVSYSTLGTQHRTTKLNPVLTHPIIQALSKKHDRSVAEVVLSWALQNNMSVIPRSSKQQHIRELARLLTTKEEDPTFFLDANDLKAIDSMKQTTTTRSK